MSTKFLDLDALQAPEQITIKLSGKTHVFKEMTVDDFIWAQHMTKEVMAAAGESDILSKTVDMLVRSFPTCPREDFSSLPLSKLNALNEFVMGVALQGAEATVKEAEEASGKEQAESPSR
jgi:hypothetical protein